MIKTPVRGMRDILPADMIIRDYLLNMIQEIASGAGYQKIETPAIEHLENLTSKQGGENESLIFKILKRGESLHKAMESGSDLTDSALRFDLTVPLARYYAANSGNLPAPFKALQIGNVWRADAPQKGRFRQFIQCDMDVLGDASILTEIDTITTVLKILSRICNEANIKGLSVNINDRRILNAAAAYAGFKEEDFGSVLISLDKNDKIGLGGVRSELVDNGYDESVIDKFIALFARAEGGVSITDFCSMIDQNSLDPIVVDNLNAIMDAVNQFGIENAKIKFNPTLVRGMGYYTGPIFECTANGLGSSIAGGGRYDKMIGKFSGGADVCACGFSIGFERMVTILSDVGFVPPSQKEMCAILIAKKASTSIYSDVMKKAEVMRKSGQIVSVLPMSKNLSRQIELLEKSGYSKFEKVYGD